MLSIFTSIYLSTHLSIFTSIYLSMFPSIYLSFFLSNFLFIYHSFYLPFYQSFFSIYPFIYLFLHCNLYLISIYIIKKFYQSCRIFLTNKQICLLTFVHCQNNYKIIFKKHSRISILYEIS